MEFNRLGNASSSDVSSRYPPRVWPARSAAALESREACCCRISSNFRPILGILTILFDGREKKPSAEPAYARIALNRIGPTFGAKARAIKNCFSSGVGSGMEFMLQVD